MFRERALEDVLVTASAIIVCGRIVSWGVIPWWRSIIRSPAIDVRIRGIITTVRILEPATRGWIIINRTTSSWRRTVSTSTIIIIVATARWAPITISITTRAITTGRATTIVFIRRVGSTRSGRSGAGTVTGDIWLSLAKLINSNVEEKDAYIGNTGDTGSLELAAVKLFYCGLEIRSSLKLNKASDL